MSEYRITGFEMNNIKTESEQFSFPLARTIRRLGKITDNLKKQGMRFAPSPDSFFLAERPEGKNASYYDEKTDSFVYVQPPKV